MSNLPSSARVIAILRSDGTLIKSNDEIEEGQDFFRVVIDKGSEHGIEFGTRFLLYAFGDELFDSISGESLGYFEVVRGEGRVAQVQPKMSVVMSERKRRERRYKNNALMALSLGKESELEYVTVAAAFKGPRIGDFARLI